MSVNKVILLGNVGRDPEVRYIDKDVAVANFPLATSERGFTNQNGVQVPERTEWHNIVAWRGLAKLAESYIRKGSQLYIEGRLQTRSWEKDGVVRYTTEIVADVIQLLDRRERTTDNGTANAVTASEPPMVSEPQPGDDLPF